MNITCGGLQGSILGPLLFIIYINDIINSSSLLHFILFVDDTNLFYSHKDFVVLQARVNCELCKLSIWFRANRLSLNVDKTNYIIFGNKHLPNDSSLNIDNTVIQHVNSTKFLGVYIDSTPSWKIHVNHVASKIAQGIGALNRAKFIVPDQSYSVCITL